MKRQEADCAAVAARKGWPEPVIYVDDDVSAYVPGRRPAYAQMLADIKDGTIDAVVVYDLDRLHRHPWELEEFFRTCDAAGLIDLASVAGDVNLATSDGQFHARIMGAVAKKSSDDKSRRLVRKHLELAEAGKSHGGPRPYGFDADGVTVREDEAEVLREAARRVLDGDGLRGICMDFNLRGLTTSTGAEWAPRTLRRLLLGARVAGLRVHQGAVVGPASWPAIIDAATYAKVRAILEDPARGHHRAPRKHVLLGLARCGRCGALLRSKRLHGYGQYACLNTPGIEGCGGITVSSERLEGHVVAMVLDAIDSPEFTAARRAKDAGDDTDEVIAAIAGDEAKLLEYADDYDEGRIGKAEWMRLRAKVDARLTTARRAVSRRRVATPLDAFDADPGALRAQWEGDEFSLDRKRAIIGAVLDRVIVAPAVRGRNRFDPERVTLVWRV